MKKIILMTLCLLLALSLFACGEKTEKPDNTPEENQTEENKNTEKEGEEGKEEKKAPVTIDLILFAGGANMSGAGATDTTATFTEGHAYEFKAVSDPVSVVPLTADFGKDQNKTGGITASARSAGIVPAFCEAYYQATNTAVVAVAASGDNAPASSWNAGLGQLEDLLGRLATAKEFLTQSEEYTLGHTYLVWFQGEADGMNSVSADAYAENFGIISKAVLKRGVEKIFMIGIGPEENDATKFLAVQNAQRAICEENESIVFVSDIATTLSENVHDGYLFDKDGYAAIGADAAAHVAEYLAAPDSYTAPDSREHVSESNTPFDGKKIELPAIAL